MIPCQIFAVTNNRTKFLTRLEYGKFCSFPGLIVVIPFQFSEQFFFVLCQQVIAVVCVENPAEADRMSLDLPIMKKMGDRVHIECKSIRPIGEWVEDLKKLAE